MKKLLLNLLTLLFLAGWMFAQQDNSAQSNAANPSNSAQGDRQVTLQGCLAASGSDYTLRANGGKPYQLQGHTSELKQHLGEYVEIEGNQSNSLSTTGATEPSSGSASPLMVQVRSIRKLEDKCPAPPINR